MISVNGEVLWTLRTDAFWCRASVADRRSVCIRGWTDSSFLYVLREG